MLRGDRLSCYKDTEEHKLHRQIMLVDITAVAQLKDAKTKFVFGVFSPSRNFRFRAQNEQEAEEWAETIRKAAEVDETDKEYYLNSPVNPADQVVQIPLGDVPPDTRLGTSSSDTPRSPTGGLPSRQGRLSIQTLDYSGPEFGSVSSFSDMARGSQLSLGRHNNPSAPTEGVLSEDEETSNSDPQAMNTEPIRTGVVRNNSGLSMQESLPREIWHGFLWCLKSRAGVKQWKKYWVVVKNINVTFYKNEKEFRAIKILPMDSIVDAVETEPLSKSRRHCMQIITQGKVFKLSAINEDDLVNSLGALKSVLSKMKHRASISQSVSPQGITSPIAGSAAAGAITPAAAVN